MEIFKGTGMCRVYSCPSGSCARALGNTNLAVMQSCLISESANVVVHCGHMPWHHRIRSGIGHDWDKMLPRP